MSLEKVIIPRSVSDLGIGAFGGCTEINKVTFDDLSSLTSISDHVFSNCTSLTTITIPKSVTNIGERAFYECSNLKQVIIRNDNIKIGKSVFENCGNLSSIVIMKNKYDKKNFNKIKGSFDPTAFTNSGMFNYNADRKLVNF